MKMGDYLHRRHDQIVVTWLTLLMLLIAFGTMALLYVKVNY